MFATPARRRILLGILLASMALLYVGCAMRLGGLAADDSFIHRRIALNYVKFRKPYFNVDQRVMVTSSPVWTLLLAAGGILVPAINPVPWIELILLLLGPTAAYLLACDVCERETWPGLAIPAFAFTLVCLGDLPSAIDQMETPCAIALMLCGALGLSRHKNWGLPLLVLACFTRYECSLFFLLAAVYVTVRRRWTTSSFLACAGIGMLGIAWLMHEYGTVIPNTVVAKSLVYAVTYQEVFQALTSNVRAVLLFVLGVLWWFHGRDRHPVKNSIAFLLAGFGLVLGLAYVLRKTMIFPWYMPLILIPISVGILLWTDTGNLRRVAIGVGLAGILVLPPAKMDRRLVQAALRGAPDYISGFPVAARVHEYRRIGSALYAECPTASLMTSEIGGLGWAFPGKVLDGAALASPEAIRYHPMRVPEERSKGTMGELPAGFVRDRHPDLIVTYDILGESAVPAARALGYVDYTYPLFVREDRTRVDNLWGARQMHVLVAPDGHCAPAAIDRAVRPALEQ